MVPSCIFQVWKNAEAGFHRRRWSVFVRCVFWFWPFTTVIGWTCLIFIRVNVALGPVSITLIAKYHIWRRYAALSALLQFGCQSLLTQ